MAKKYIELTNEKGETKRYHAPGFIKGSVAREGLQIGKKLDEMKDSVDPDVLLEIYQFIADKLYDGQFTAQEFEDGVDARKIIRIATEQLANVLGGEEGK
ncbi:phage tail assembly chaperone G [Staphylococcus auricularis]|uniref:phage tail assembly chaperone G n=1 Tax=Staphylococcus auricularis TaxID=29379 RepID=UPI00242AD503|nr:hypothetical protein [Staphylococcus auricularis]